MAIMSVTSRLKLSAIGRATAVVDVPGSKSITNRAFLIGALASGQTTLLGPLHSDDTVAMVDCLVTLGITIDESGPDITRIIGSSGTLIGPSKPLFANNSGTTIRFLTAAAALSPTDSHVVLDGNARMRQRPIRDLVEALHQLGVTTTTQPRGYPPVDVLGGGIRGGRCYVKGDVSSQYLSALLMVAPYAQTDVEIFVDGELVSKPYVDITLSIMSDFGVKVRVEGDGSFRIPSSQVYRGHEYSIEPDASNASYFLAAAAVTAGTVTVNNLGTSSIQGDIAVIDVLEQMGCQVSRSPYAITVSGPQTLIGVDVDAKRIPDMAQTIAVAACFATGSTRISGLDNLRVKETDRIAAMATELRKTGATVTEGKDYLVIIPTKTPIAAEIDTYDDHRMAMSFAVAGLRIGGLTIKDPECVGKTFPDFWQRWERAFPGSITHEENYVG